MPFKIPAEQATFKFSLSEVALPIGRVERWGSGLWLLVCPLCGMLHDVSRFGDTTTEYEPACMVKRTHPAVYKAWIAAHPQAADYTRVTLQRTPNVIPLAAPQTVEKAA